MVARNLNWISAFRAVFFMLDCTIPAFHAFQIAFLAENSNREICSVLSYTRERRRAFHGEMI